MLTVPTSMQQYMFLLQSETAAKTDAPQKLYTVTLSADATQTINEASVANALVKGTNNATDKDLDCQRRKWRRRWL